MWISMRKIVLFCGFGLVGIAVSITGCSSLSYDAQYDESVDFSAYETYGWIPRPDDATSYSTLLKQRVDRSVENELNAKGFSKANSDPDMIAVYHLNTERRVTGATIDRWGYGYGRWGGGGTVNYNEYEEGTLFLDLVDAGRKEVIWRGTVNGAVGSGEPSQEDIDKVIGKLLAEFPPGSAE